MITSKEEKQINRPLLYLAGGLVLGETMALWMTVKQDVFWLAVLLLVCSCVFARDNVRGHGRERCRLLAIFCGVCIGAWRMELEQSIIGIEEMQIDSFTGEIVTLEGTISEIGQTDYGSRLVMKSCIMSANEENVEQTGEERIRTQVEDGFRLRKIYAYVDSDTGFKLGMQVRVRGELTGVEPDRNPGQFHFRNYCLAKGICGSLAGDSVELVDSRYLWVQEWLRQVGLLLEQRLVMIAPSEDVGLLKAILLGEKGDMDDEVYRLYQKNGISHVLAISGLHVSVIGMGLWSGLRRLGAGYWSAGAVAFGMLFAFGSIAGFGPSVIRAVFMMGLSFLAGAFGRTYDLPSAMSVPAMGLLLVNPYLLTQASFQLSFLAVTAIFFPGEYLSKVWKLTGFWQNLWTSVSIQFLTLPAVLYHSFEIPVYGIILNLLVVPLMTYVLISGILGLAGSFLWMPLGPFLLGGAHYILRLYQMACRLMERVSGAYLVLGRPGFLGIAAYYGCLVVGVWMAAARAGEKGNVGDGDWLKWKVGAMRLGTVVLLGIAGLLILAPTPPRGLEVTFLDVGQGDSIVIRCGFETLLVDCGSSQKKTIGEDCLVPFLKSKGVTKLDAVFVTHGDQDHISGVRALLEHPDWGIEIEELIIPVTGAEDPACETLVQLAEEQGIPIRVLQKEDPKSLLPTASQRTKDDFQIECLHPGVDDGLAQADRNDGSLVLRFRYGDFSMLLTGDVEKTGEEQILQDGKLGSVTVLKAAHHGSASSSSWEFLEAADPEYVIFSYGAGNRYGHPADAVVERCLEIGAKICSTAESGAVILRTDGKNMQIRGWLDRKGGI